MRIIRKPLQTGGFALLFFLFACSLWAQSESMDELYKKALKEGGTLNFYGTLAQISADKVLPAFEKRFPGIKINHVDATSSKCRRHQRVPQIQEDLGRDIQIAVEKLR